MFEVIAFVMLGLVAVGATVCAVVQTLGRRQDEHRWQEREYNLKKEIVQQQLDRERSLRQLQEEMVERGVDRLSKENGNLMSRFFFPLKEKIDDFSQSINRSHAESQATGKSLFFQLDRLMQLNNTIGEEARNLANALKGDSKVQGDWGEMVLETLLQREGLQRGVNYDTQVTRNESGQALKDEAGGQLRPDVVINLPDGRKLIVDSKTSLKAYVDYCSAADPESRDVAAKRHISSVRSHIDELDRKQYQKVVEGSAEYVIMFIPNDGAFMAALSIGPELWDYASKRRVVLASPSHLMTVIKLTAQLWREERQRTNALEIARTAGLLYDKVVAFTQDLQNIERHLNSASSAYRNAYSKLVEGSQSVVSRAERLRELGAKTSKRMGGSILSDNSLST